MPKAKKETIERIITPEKYHSVLNNKHHLKNSSNRVDSRFIYRIIYRIIILLIFVMMRNRNEKRETKDIKLKFSFIHDKGDLFIQPIK